MKISYFLPDDKTEVDWSLFHSDRWCKLRGGNKGQVDSGQVTVTVSSVNGQVDRVTCAVELGGQSIL